MPRPSDRPKSQVESHAPGQCLVFWPEAKARQGTTSALAELRVGGSVRKPVPYYSSVLSSLAPKDDPRRPAFMFLVVPIVRILYLARQRLSEAVRGRLFPSIEEPDQHPTRRAHPARPDRGPFTAAADKTRRVPSIGQWNSWKQL